MSLSVLSADIAVRSIPEYDCIRLIGKGAYGQVWLARNVTGSYVALKIVERSAFEHQRPFEREFEGIKRFEPISRTDSSQVSILHVGRGEDYFYYVMELADNASTSQLAPSSQAPSPTLSSSAVSSAEVRRLTSKSEILNIKSEISYTPLTLKRLLLDHGAPPTERCIEIAISLTHALTHLHKNGLVHRDIKPSNVIFVNGVAKLADIGLVTSVDATRSWVGTEGYLPLEGAGTPQADIYSLGKLLYELSTGCDRSQFPMLPPDIATRPDRAALSELNAVVVRACQRDPNDRYQSAEEMERDLAVLRRGESIQRRRQLASQRSMLKKAALFAAAAALAFFLLVGARQRKHALDYPDGLPSTNMEANVLSAKALLIVRGDNHQAFAQAYTNLHQAIALDPNFAQPYVGLYELRSKEIVPELPGTTLDELKGIAERLNALEPNLGATYSIRSMVQFCSLQFPAALANARKSVSVSPRYEMGHLWLAFILIHIGMPEEGRREAQIAREIAPSKGTVYRILGHSYFVQRDYPNAIAMYRRALVQEPHEVSLLCLGDSLEALGRFDEAIDCFQKHRLFGATTETEIISFYAKLREAVRSEGPPGYWRQRWMREVERPNSDFYEKALIQTHLGNKAAALDWAEKSYSIGETVGFEPPVLYLLFNPEWDEFRKDPRFQRLLKEVGFTEVNPSLIHN